MAQEKLCDGPDCENVFVAKRTVDKFCCRKCNQKAQDKRKRDRRLGIYTDVEIRDNPEEERNPLVAARFEYLQTKEKRFKTEDALPVKEWIATLS